MKPKLTFCDVLRRTMLICLSLALFLMAKNAVAQVPTISSFSPSSAVPGASVTLTGANFNPNLANNIVYFGAMRATVTAASATSLTVTVPKGSTYTSISVLNTATSLTGFTSKPFLANFTPAKTTLSASDFSLAANINGAGSNLYSLTYADLDNDGKPELITSDNFNQYVYIQPNTSIVGATSFGPMISIDLSALVGTGQLRQITTGDVDGDGLPEIIVSNAAGTSSKVFIIKNTGVFDDFVTTTPSFFAAGINATGIAVGDIDNDGRLDVLTGNASSNSFSVLINTSVMPGIISFASKQDFNIGGSPVYLKTADFNNDGKADVCVTSNNGPSALVLTNTSTGSTLSFDTPITMGTLSSIAGINTGDLDGDGAIDLIVCSAAASNICIFKNTTVGATTSFAARQDVAVGTRQIVSALGDLNGDGKPDLLTSDYQSFGTAPTYRISILNNTSNSGNISFGTATTLAADNLPTTCAIIDMDGDGKSDLVSGHSTNHNIIVYRNNTTAPPKITSISPSQGIPGSSITLTGEFNPNSTKNMVYFGTVKGTVTASTGTSLSVTVPNGASYSNLNVLDTESGLSVYSRQYFLPTFSPSRPSLLRANDFTLDGHINTGMPSRAYGMQIADLDDDGKPDLIMNNGTPADNKIYIRKNTSAGNTISFGTIISNAVVGADQFEMYMSVGDIDGDGKQDIIAPARNTNNMVVFRNTGSLSAFAPTTIATGTWPSASGLADFDNDGKIDVAIINYSDLTVSVFKNSSSPGNVSFDAALNFPIQGNGSYIQVGDFNNDGKVDMIVVRGTSNLIRIYENTTTGSTISFAISDFTVTLHPNTLTASDLDGDGDLDLILTQGTSTKFGILTNNSTTSIAFSFQEIEVGTNQTYSSLADLNGDGKPDLLLGSSKDYGTLDYRMNVLTNTSTAGNISFSPKFDLAAQRYPGITAMADLNGDGKPDIISSDFNLGKLSIYRNTLQFPPTITSFAPAHAAPGTNITLTGSGFSTTLTNNIVYFGPVKATVIAASSTSLTVAVPFGAAHSLISVLNTGSSMIGYSLQKFFPVFTPNKTTLRASDLSTPISLATVYGAYDVVAGDLDGDGKPELLIDDTNNQISIHPNTSTSGSISFGTRTNLTSNQGIRYMNVGDVDADGKLDIIVPNLDDNNISIFRNSGSGSISFDSKVSFATGLAPVTSVLADLDGDGKPELVVGNYNVDNISILRNATTGNTISFDPKIDFTVGTSPVSISAIDVDGDGKLDLVISASNSSSGNMVSILRNISTGSISFAAPVTLATGVNSSPWINAAGDIDGDGKPDIVVANVSSNNVAVFRNTSTSGSVTFDPKITLATGVNPKGMSLGDINGDGKLDIVIANEDGNSLMAFANTSNGGTISFASSLNLAMPASSSPRAVTIVDLDGDGKPDIATANGVSSATTIFRNQLITTPVTQASNLTFTTQTTTSSQLAWTNGSGQKSAVFVKANETTGAAVPVDDTDYTADVAFGNGSQIGTSGWFCVYNGTGSSVTVTGLDPATTYRAMVVSLNDNSLPNVALYNTSTATGNPLNFIPASTITAISKADASPTIATTVNYTVTFNNAVTGLSATNFDLSTTGLTGASIVGLSGSGTSYNVEVNTGTGDGELTLRLANASGIDHALTNTLPFTGETYAIDKTAPVFNSSGVPTNATYKTGQNLDFTVTFPEPVTVVTTGGIPTLSLVLNTGGTVQASYLSGTGTATLTFRYTVAAGNEDTDGVTPGNTIVLNGGTIKDAVGHDADLSVSFPSSVAVLVDAVAPVTNSITRKTPTVTLTNASSLVFHVIFNEDVSGIDITDFNLTKTGTANGSIAAVSSASGTAIDVTVNAVSGNGTLRLDLNNTGTNIIDDAGNVIDEGFITGELYTIDQAKPTLSLVTIASNNAITTKAVTGNTVTLNFTSSETIAMPTVAIAGHNITATNVTANNWTAGYTMASTDTEGNVAFSIAFSDQAGNAGTTVTATTNSSAVSFDRTVPTLSSVDISSNNAVTALAKTGNTVTLNFTATETIATPTVSIAGHNITPTNANGNDWTASYTMASTDTEGNIAFSIAFSDQAGNAGTAVTATTNSSAVIFDRTTPTLSSVGMASDNAITTIAKTGNKVTITFTASETISTPTVSIAGHSVTATNTTANNWTASYTMANADTEGNVAFSIAFSDQTGNVGTAVTATTNSSGVVFDKTVPTLSSVGVSSNNAVTTLAKTGNVVTLSFTSSEVITVPTVSIAGHNVIATNGSGNNWTAGYTMANADTEGNVAFSIAFSDQTGNAGTTVTATTNSSAVNFDKTAPILSVVDIVSNNAIPTKAIDGNTITLNFTANEVITPVVTIASQSITATHASGNNWQAVYTVTAASPVGPVSFTIAYADRAGNAGTTFSTTTDGSNMAISHLSAIATLASLSLSEGTLNPVFNTATLAYSATVANTVATIKLTPIASDAAANVKVNGTTVIYGNSSADLPLAIGSNTLTVAVTSPDGTNLQTYTITITREPSVVLDISMNAAALFENQPANTLAGTFNSTSNDPSATFSYSLVNGSGATDNALFAINGNELRTMGSLDFETKSSYSLRIKSTAPSGLSLEKAFIINLNDINEIPTLAAIANQSVCTNATVKTINLTGITPGPETAQSTTLSVSSSNNLLFSSLTVGAVNAGTAVLSFIPASGATGTATVTVTVTDNGGTANGGVNHSSQSFTVTVNALPSPSIASNLGTKISKGETLQLRAIGAQTYQWSNADGIISGQNTAILTVRPTKTTTYWVTASNATGCSQLASITIEISEDYMAIKPSNILTPNGDGVNDTWVVENIDAYPNNIVKVFDRAGRILFTKQGYDNTWDGSVNGQRLTEGTYYYIIDFGAQKLKQKGYITLIRE